MNHLDILRGGDIEVLGLLPFSSNHVFLVEVGLDDSTLRAVYKPARGERRLWDFPHGTLGDREEAAYLVSEAGGFGLVPPTVIRDDAPFGRGSLQVFIDHDPNRHFFVLVHERRDELMSFAAFDIVIDNADRKAGHVIEDAQGNLWGVDHGLSFNVDPKLRTVIWAFAELRIPEVVSEKLERLDADLTDGLGRALGERLSEPEVIETQARTRALLRAGVFPSPEGPFHMPWPLV